MLNTARRTSARRDDGRAAQPSPVILDSQSVKFDGHGSAVGYDADLRVDMAFLLTMPGVPYLYAGDEIGQRYVDGLVSKEGGYNRTGARTPMQWDGSPGAGFSTAPSEKFYLPLDPSPDRPNVAAQERDPDSLLNFVRRLLALRRKIPALGNDAPFAPLYAEGGQYPFVYQRGTGPDSVIVAVNPSGREERCRFPFPAGTLAPLLPAHARFTRQGDVVEATLPPVSFAILSVE